MSKAQPRQRFAQPASIVIFPHSNGCLFAVRVALQHEPGLVILPETANLTDKTTHPDLVLIGACGSDLDEFALIRTLKDTVPHTPILVITMHDSHEYLITLLRAGAVGYLRGDTPCHDVIEAIYQALGGHMVAPNEVATRALQVLAATYPSQIGPPPIHLTQRERDVLHLLVQQQSNRQIGQALEIGEGTVKTYVKRIFAKLGISQRAEVASRVTELHLLDI